MNPNRQAFPHSAAWDATSGGEVHDAGADGMTYREWLAGITLAQLAGGLCAADTVWTPEQHADEAVRLADALIARLAAPKPPPPKLMPGTWHPYGTCPLCHGLVYHKVHEGMQTDSRCLDCGVTLEE